MASMLLMLILTIGITLRTKHDPSYFYVPHVLCYYCESSDHDADTCPYDDVVDATCAGVEKVINELTDIRDYEKENC